MILYRFLLLFMLLGITNARGQNTSYVKVYIEQNGKKYLLNNQTVKLERKPFTLIFEFTKPDTVAGIYINTSLLPEPYYLLLPSQEIPEFEYLPQKVLSEYKFNPHKELKVHPEFFQYWSYNPHRNWNKFDRIEKRDGKIIAYRRIENLDFVKQSRRIPVEDNRRSLYLFFTVVKKDPRSFSGLKEWERFKAKLKF